MANYYWVDKGSTFGGGDGAIQAGDQMPAEFQNDPRFESFKAHGLISTEKVPSKRQLSELEQLREQAKSKISQSDLDAATAKSVQSDLDKIAELEKQLEEAAKPRAGRPPKDK